MIIPNLIPTATWSEYTRDQKEWIGDLDDWLRATDPNAPLPFPPEEVQEREGVKFEKTPLTQYSGDVDAIASGRRRLCLISPAVRGVAAATQNWRAVRATWVKYNADNLREFYAGWEFKFGPNEWVWVGDKNILPVGGPFTITPSGENIIIGGSYAWGAVDDDGDRIMSGAFDIVMADALTYAANSAVFKGEWVSLNIKSPILDVSEITRDFALLRAGTLIKDQAIKMEQNRDIVDFTGELIPNRDWYDLSKLSEDQLNWVISLNDWLVAGDPTQAPPLPPVKTLLELDNAGIKPRFKTVGSKNSSVWGLFVQGVQGEMTESQWRIFTPYDNLWNRWRQANAEQLKIFYTREQKRSDEEMRIIPASWSGEEYPPPKYGSWITLMNRWLIAADPNEQPPMPGSFQSDWDGVILETSRLGRWQFVIDITIPVWSEIIPLWFKKNADQLDLFYGERLPSSPDDPDTIYPAEWSSDELRKCTKPQSLWIGQLNYWLAQGDPYTPPPIGDENVMNAIQGPNPTAEYLGDGQYGLNFKFVEGIASWARLANTWFEKNRPQVAEFYGRVREPQAPPSLPPGVGFDKDAFAGSVDADMLFPIVDRDGDTPLQYGGVHYDVDLFGYSNNTRVSDDKMYYTFTAIFDDELGAYDYEPEEWFLIAFLSAYCYTHTKIAPTNKGSMVSAILRLLARVIVLVIKNFIKQGFTKEIAAWARGDDDWRTAIQMIGGAKRAERRKEDVDLTF